MSWADRLAVDEISQCDRAIRFLLKGSASDTTQRLVNYLEDANDGPNPGKMFLHESESDQMPGELSALDRPCLVMAPASLSVEAWRTPQSSLGHAVAILGFVDGRTSEPVNRLIMLTLRALFQRKGQLPDTLQISDGAAANHDPETQSLDFVQSMKLASTIQRKPFLPFQDDQDSGLTPGRSAGYKTWGFRMVLAIELRADLLQGG